jgi:hypothetical protein
MISRITPASPSSNLTNHPNNANSLLAQSPLHQPELFDYVPITETECSGLPPTASTSDLSDSVDSDRQSLVTNSPFLNSHTQLLTSR